MKKKEEKENENPENPSGVHDARDQKCALKCENLLPQYLCLGHSLLGH